MNKDKINLYNCYQGNSNTIDPIFQALDCFEQIGYLMLKGHNIVNPLFFCKSITPVFVEYKNQTRLELLRKNLWNEEWNIFQKEKVPVYESNYFEAIKDIIDKGDCVSFSTMFDLVYPYCWYDKDSKGNHCEHLSTIVDYDEENYYVIDSPFVFEPTRNKVCEFNKSVNIIPIQYLHKGFEVHCNLFRLVLKENILDRYPNIIEIIKRNIEEYNCKYESELEDCFIFYGHRALIRLQKCVKSKEFKILEKTSFNSYWNIHLILSRHILLRMCLVQEKEIFSDKQFDEILTQLNQCIFLWDKLKVVIMKHCYKTDELLSFQDSVDAIVDNILIQEDKLFDKLLLVVKN